MKNGYVEQTITEASRTKWRDQVREDTQIE